jgi:hypothetical protein
MSKPRTPDGDEQTYLLRGIPPELWRQMKAAAALKGESIRDALLRAIREYVKRASKK